MRSATSRPFTFIATLVALVFAITPPNTERLGDAYQVVLPVAALACMATEGRGVQYFGRYVAMEVVLKSSKIGLGDAEINQRPRGGDHGFPSGHTAASVFGAVGLINSCLQSSKSAQAVAILTAGFVSGSRIEAGAHNLWQVVAGALLGWGVHFLTLTAFDRMFARFAQSLARGIARLRKGAVSGAIHLAQFSRRKELGNA